MSEKIIEKHIIQYLRLQGAYCEGLNSGAIKKPYKASSGQTRYYSIKLMPAGTPDVLCIHKGKPIFIEVKKDAKELKKWENTKDTDRRSAAQHFQQDRIRSAGGYAIAVYSLDDCIAKLSALDLL